MSTVKYFLRKYTMLIALALVVIVFQTLTMLSTKTNPLLTPANITDIIAQNAYVVMLGCGMLICILTGGNIDLSVGSQVALISAIGGTLIMSKGMNIYLSIAICLLVGILVGAWQGFWIAYVRVPAFIVTLAGMLTFRGIALVVLKSQTIPSVPSGLSKYFISFLPGNAPGAQTNPLQFLVTMGVGAALCVAFIGMQIFSRINKNRKKYSVENIWSMIARIVFLSAAILVTFYMLSKDRGIPVILILLSIIVLVYSYFTDKTVPGRRIYAMGGNEKAAKLSGVNTNRLLFFAYTNMGFLCAITALFSMSRLGASTTTVGANYELDAIGACYIGGASAYGGVGTIMGTVVGAAFMGVLNNGMTLMGIGESWKPIIKGLVLLVAVVVDIIMHNRVKGGSKKKQKGPAIPA